MAKANDNKPSNLDAEASLLGAVLIDPNAMTKIADKVAPIDFFGENHARIYEAMVALYEKRSDIDVLTVADFLRGVGYLDFVGGSAYLAELTNFVPTATHVEQYAEIVATKSLRRRLISAANEMSDLGKDESQDLKTLIEDIESKIFEISDRHINNNAISMESVLTSSFERLDSLHKDKGQLRGIPTNFRDLDNLLAGLQNSDLFILAARPSMGKTAFVLNLAKNIAQGKQKKAVLVFSLEMGKEQLVDRLLAMESGVDAWALRTGKLTDDDFIKIGQAMGPLSESRIFIDDTPAITISELRTKVRREAHNHNADVVIVDYLQLMSGGGRFASDANRVQEISAISRGLKSIAREMNIPVIALSQLSRSVESRQPKIPQLADLRESGSIEQDADVVAFLYREDYYEPESERKNIMDVLIKKHRNGPTGAVELYFDRDKQRIRSIDTSHSTPFNE